MYGLLAGGTGCLYCTLCNGSCPGSHVKYAGAAGSTQHAVPVSRTSLQLPIPPMIVRYISCLYTCMGGESSICISCLPKYVVSGVAGGGIVPAAFV